MLSGIWIVDGRGRKRRNPDRRGYEETTPFRYTQTLEAAPTSCRIQDLALMSA